MSLLGLQSLGQLEPAGMDCADIKRVYEREKRLSKTRSKKSHRLRHKRNAERFQAAFEECKGAPPEIIPVAAGGLPDPLLALTTGFPGAGTAVPQRRMDYTRLGMIVAGGVVLVGGLIWLLAPKKKPPAPKIGKLL